MVTGCFRCFVFLLLNPGLSFGMLRPVFILLFLCATLGSFGQKSNPDSLYLRQFTLETKRAYSEARNADDLPEKTLDSLLHEMNSSISASGFTTSPDDRFTIYVAEMESCGAYCNSEWVSRLVMKSRKNKPYNPVAFEPVYSIDLLPDGSYLVITNYGARPAGWYTTSSFAAYVIRMEGEDWVQVPAFESELPYSETTDEDGGRALQLQQEQEFFIGTEQTMTYDEASRQIIYRFGFATDLNGDSQKALELEGYYKFVDDHFVHQEETVRVIRWEE
jgi:hypothetical protein